MRLSRILAVTSFVAANLSLLGAAAYGAMAVEPFDGTLNFSTAAATGGTTVDHAGSLGGELDVFIEQLNGSATVTAQNSGGAFTHGNGTGPFAISRLTLAWDGNDNNAATLNPTGLQTGGTGINLVAAGNAFRLSGLSVDLQGSFILSVFTDATHVSTRSFTLTPTVPTPMLELPFSSFTGAGANGAADFANVGAISLQLTGGNFGLDFAINDVSVVPEPATATMGVGAFVLLSLAHRRRRRAD